MDRDKAKWRSGILDNLVACLLNEPKGLLVAFVGELGQIGKSKRVGVMTIGQPTDLANKGTSFIDALSHRRGLWIEHFEIVFAGERLDVGKGWDLREIVTMSQLGHS